MALLSETCKLALVVSLLTIAPTLLQQLPFPCAVAKNVIQHQSIQNQSVWNFETLTLELCSVHPKNCRILKIDRIRLAISGLFPMTLDPY